MSRCHGNEHFIYAVAMVTGYISLPDISRCHGYMAGYLHFNNTPFFGNNMYHKFSLFKKFIYSLTSEYSFNRGFKFF